MKLTDMKLSPKERKSEGGIGPSEYKGPDYPYGTSLRLDTAALKKLGIKELPEVGDEFEITACGKVTSVNQSASERGNDSKSMELQLVEIGLEEKETGKSLREELAEASDEKGKK